MNTNKTELRKQILKKRQELSKNSWQIKSSKICQNLIKNSLFTEAETILAYFSFRKEPDLSSLFKDKQYGFPRCSDKVLNWYFWQPPQILKSNRYNILEPLDTAPLVLPQQADLILVPTVACDVFGYRLGYGGGYYDRLLCSPEWQNIPTIGIVFDFAYLPQLPVESWDIKLDYICTELGIKKNN